MKIKIFAISLLFGLIEARPKNINPTEDLTKIERIHINSTIQMRYAVTKVETRVKNLHSEAQEIFFDMYIPIEAFVSNFSMTIKSKTYVAKVDTKENAQAIYDNSSTTSGLVQSKNEFKDTKQVS